MPITSYYKLIDWWLLALFNILVLTLGFHTYLSHIVSEATDEQNVRNVKISFLKTDLFRSDPADSAYVDLKPNLN